MRRYLSVAIVTLCFVPCFVSGQTVDWSNAFRFRTTGGFENPALLVAFNPQPEPPASFVPVVVDLSEPTMLTLTIDDIAVSGGSARILFAVEEGFFINAEGEPDADMFEFETIGQGVQNFQMNMSTGSGGIPSPGSWVGFNPQPEPPAGFNGMAFDFNFSSNSPATLVIQSLDDGVVPLTFELLQTADFDSDGDVDEGDLKIWSDNFGTGELGDANFNGLTDGDDFLVWQRQYTGPVTITPIPEPGGLATALSGLAMLLFVNLRRY